MKVHRSKLETYEDILNVLSKEASSVDRISYETNVSCDTVRRSLRFMIKNGLVEERRVGGLVLNVLTERGAGVLRTLTFQKHVAKIKHSLEAIDETT